MIDDTLNNNQIPVENTPENNQEAPETVQEVMTPKRDELAELKEINFRNMREAAERERKRNEQLEQEIADMRRSSKPSEPDDLDSDDLAEKRQVKKYRDEMRAANEQLTKKAAAIEEQMQKLESQAIINEVVGKFPDFYSVVTDDTLAMLKRKEPELFESTMETKNQKAKLVAAYKNIKTHINTRNYDAQDAKIIENKTKPRSASTVPVQDATTPLSTFSETGRWKLTREEAKSLREDTAKCARNR